MNKNKVMGVLASLGLMVTLGACTADDSDVVDSNITKMAKNFEVNRRVVVVNGITDKIQLQAEGRCNVDPKATRIFITCKVADGEGPDSYLRHAIYRSDNVFVFVEQGEPVEANAYHYRFTFKPQSIIPDPDFRGSTSEGPQEQN